MFFAVLARKQKDRHQDLQQTFAKVPYLNSSLFEITDLENKTFLINNLYMAKELPFLATTVLKDREGKRVKGVQNTLLYLLSFLDAYNFGSTNLTEIQEESKTLINSAVLGLIFEKINGYKDGSFFTPSFITMYMCRETIRKAVLQKFKEIKGWDCETIPALYDKITDKKEASKIVNTLKICDPAVGSGHFLVSALNEIIAVKSELKILLDRTGKTLRDYTIEVINDELVITNDDDELFAYYPPGKERSRVQEALFHEKQFVIENCLFGVDINPNSVKICQLRLWIELLKNAYYRKGTTELETLPNIDINIKCGNSLINRLKLDDKLNNFDASRRQYIKRVLPDYKQQVELYKSVTDRKAKRVIVQKLQEYRTQFAKLYNPKDKDYQAWKQKENEWLTANLSAFPNPLVIEKLNKEREKLAGKYQDKYRGYENTFEWRYEFPEVLDKEGNFIGFDVIIGNPPYGVSLTADQKSALHQIYDFGTSETAILFIKKGFELLKPFGKQSYIIPKSYAFASNYERIRQFTQANLTDLVDCGKVWADVKLEVCIFQLDKAKRTKTYASLQLEEDKLQFIAPIKKSVSQQFGFFLNGLTEKEIAIGLKMLQTCQTLNDIATNQRGAMLQKFVQSSKSRVRLKVIGGAEVQKYGVQSIKGKISKTVVKDDKAFIKPTGLLVQNIIAHIQNPIDHIKITACVPTDKSLILLDTINQIVPKTGFSPLFIWAILQAKLINWYMYLFVFGKAIRTMHFDNPTTSKLPIPKNCMDKQQPIIELVNKILKAKKEPPTTNTEKLENQIDQLVYQLYQLTPQEIEIITQQT